MGTSSSNPFREGSQLMSQFNITFKNQEAFLTHLVHKRTQKEYVLRQLTYTEQRQYTINCQKAKNRQNIKNKHITHLQRIEQRNQDNMCSNFIKMYTLWQYSSRSLHDEIKQRALQRKPFENVELWSILASSIMALAAFQQRDIRHECLTTKAILMQSDGNVKIVDPMAVGLQTNFQSIFNNRTQKNIYLSPQQCEAIQSQKPIINKNAFKNDVFSMAIILLQSGLLERQDQSYLDDCSRINWSKIQTNVNRFGEIYQEALKQMLAVMLSKDIRSRPDWLDLDVFVKKNTNTEKKVLNFNPPIEKRTHFIRRTVQHSLPNKNGIAKNNITQTPAQQQQNSSRFFVPVTQHYQEQRINPLTSYSEVKQVLYSSPFPQQNLGTKLNQPSPKYFSHNQPLPVLLPPADSFKSNSGIRPFQAFSLPQNIYRPTTNLHYFNSFQSYSNLPHTNQHFSTNYLQNQQPFNFEKKFTSNYNSGPSASITNTKNIKDSEYASIVDQPHKASQINSFSPINFNQYVKAAHSVDYEVIKAHSPTQLRQEIKVEPTIPFDPLINASPQISDQNIKTQQNEAQFVVEHFKLGSRYEGYKLNGQRHGKGKFYYQDGGCYDGEWKNNKMEGFGTLYYQNNTKAYEGFWVDDQFEGKGKLFNENPVKFNQFYDFNSFDDIDQYWQFYQGHFTGDQKDGKGRLKFSNGQIFQGTFKKDMVEGEGTYHCLDARKIHGVWSQNRLISFLQ